MSQMKFSNRNPIIAVTNAAGRVLEVTYTNAAGYNVGYAATLPGGGVFRREVVRDPAFPNRILACTNYFGTTAVTGFEYAFDTQSPRYRRADVPSTRGGRRASPPIEPRAERAEPDCWSLSQAEFAVYAEPDC